MIGQGIAGSDQSNQPQRPHAHRLEAAAARGLGCCWACGVSGVAVRSGSAPDVFGVCCCTRLEK